MGEHGLEVVGGSEIGDEWTVQGGSHSRVVRAGRDVFVGEQIRLQDEFDVPVERLDLVMDGGDRTRGERDESFRMDAHAASGRRRPLGGAAQGARAEVEDALVRRCTPVPHVHGLVLDEQADDAAVGHVHDGLPVLGVAVTRLRIWQGTLLVEPVEVGAGESARFTLLERATNPDVSVGQCEGGFGGVQCLQIQSAPAQLPR